MNKTNQISLVTKWSTNLYKKNSARNNVFMITFCIIAAIACAIPARINAIELPAAGWHRGVVSRAQENSRNAILFALASPYPHIEVDLIDFIDSSGKRTGLLAHECDMARTTGVPGRFMDYHSILDLPNNIRNPNLPGEPFITVIDLFELIDTSKKRGVTPIVSLDMKEEGKSGREFGQWVGNLIRSYGFQDHVFASSFYKSNIMGVEDSYPECLTGGLVFNDHWALKFLNHHHTSLDLTGLSRLTFFLGFIGKKKFPHDFVLIQDDIFLKHPNLIDYWKSIRKAKFVGVFSYNKERAYSDSEWDMLLKADWLELEPDQMQQYIKLKGGDDR